MLSEQIAERMLRQAPQMVAFSNAADIVLQLCREARALVGLRFVVANYAAPPQPWERGMHLVVAEAVRPLTGPGLSAAFAVHRRLAKNRAPIVLPDSEEHGAILRGLADAAPEPCEPHFVHGVPLLHRTGRLVGELLFLACDAEESERLSAALPVLTHLVALAAVALENAQRLGMARRDQDRLLLLAETTEEALWDWNLDTNEYWWGGGIQKLIGGGSEPVRARIDWKYERIHENDIDRVRETFAVACNSPRSSWSARYRFKRGDGTWAVVEDRGSFVREADGRAYRAIGAMRDVTALHESNEALRNNEERLRAALSASNVANRSKDEFLAMLGHELRNPLSPMVVALNLLRMRGANTREMDVLDRQVEHLTRLVDDLLDVSRITRGKVELRRELVDLADVITRATEIARPLLESRMQRVHLDVGDDLTVNGDAARLAQVLSNLVTNAAKYSERGSRIDIRARRVADRVEVRVADQGMGIAPEMLESIFDIFVQQAQTLERARGGLGLGLAIVKNLVELHGGTVSAKSPGPGQGSEFTVELPAYEDDRAPPKSSPRLAAPKPQQGALRILIVDDNRDGAEMLKEALVFAGYEVALAHDGPTALEITQHFSPAVALLDIGLPVMDGYELAALLRERFGRSLRLIAITGYGQEEDRRRSAAAGFHVHVVKPIDLDKLKLAIRATHAD